VTADAAALRSVALVRSRLERIPDLLRQTLALDLGDGAAIGAATIGEGAIGETATGKLVPEPANGNPRGRLLEEERPTGEVAIGETAIGQPATGRLACVHPVGVLDEDAFVDDVLVTGIGASSGVARVLAALFCERLAARARFVPLGAFAGEPPAGETLIVVTQGASPNARLALRAIPRFRRALVLTSTPPASDGQGLFIAQAAACGSAVLLVPPESEDGALLRVMGPATGMLAAITLVERRRHEAGLESLCHALAAIPAAVESAPERAEEACRQVTNVPVAALDGPCAFVTIGRDPVLLQGFQWKWLEGLRVPEPFGWDLLEVAHGPVQSVAERPIPFVVFADATHGRDSSLIGRLRAVIGPLGCPVFVLTSELPWPLSLLDHDAQLNALLLRLLGERPRDLGTAAGRWDDRALYGLGAD